MDQFTTSNTRRLWEKSSTHEDFLSLRLGAGDMPSPNEIEDAKEDLGSEHDRSAQPCFWQVMMQPAL